MRRRKFLTTVAAAVAAPYLIPRRVLASSGNPGANDRILAGVIGTGNRISRVISETPQDVQIAALADCNVRQMGADSGFGKTVSRRALDRFPKLPRYQDYREMLDKEKLDAVYVGTTTHARALCCIHAVQAGLDAYAEKPLTLTIEEGQVLVKATRKHERVVQVGTQCRSLPWYTWSNDLMRNGALGKIKKVIAHNFDPPVDWPGGAGQTTPDGLNWDMWCNQTELRPYDVQLHRGWTKWRAYDGGGMSWGMTGWGTHSLDMVQAVLGTDYTGPVEVWPVKPGDGHSPINMRYADGTLLELSLPRGYGAFWGAKYIGEKGTIERVKEIVSDPPELVAEHPKYAGYPTEPHLQNWIDCMRSRQRPAADVEIAHRSTSLCHLATAARDLGRRLEWDPDKERFVGDDEAARHVSVTRSRRKGYELPEIDAL